MMGKKKQAMKRGGKPVVKKRGGGSMMQNKMMMGGKVSPRKAMGMMGGGAAMSPQVAKKVLDAFANSELMPGAKGDYGLTAREQEILRLLAEGLLKKEIADALSISVNTVSTHLRRVYDKLHVNTNTGAVAKALREGII